MKDINKGKEYIFLNGEGETYMPDVPDKKGCMELAVSNFQVIGYAYGATAKEAFMNLLKKHQNPVNGNNFLKDTTFDEVMCHEVINRDKEERFSIQNTEVEKCC